MDDNKVIPLFRKNAKPERQLSQSEKILDRLNDLYEQTQSLYDECERDLPEGDVGDLGMSKDKFLGYFEAMLDSMDNTCFLITPRTDRDDAS